MDSLFLVYYFYPLVHEESESLSFAAQPRDGFPAATLISEENYSLCKEN